MHLQSIFTVLFQGLLCKWWLPKPTKNIKPLPVWGPCFFHWPLHWKVEHLWEAQNVSLAAADKQKSLSEQSDSLYEWKKHKIVVRANGGESIGSDWKSQGEVPQSTAFEAKLLDVLSFQWNLGNSKQNTLLVYWPAGWPSQITPELGGSCLITYRTNEH